MRYCEAEAAALKGLKHSTKIVALMLAARTSDNTPDWPGRYVSFPSIPTLINDTGLQKRALYYAINELVEAKVIRVYKDRRPGSRWDHNVYEWTATESPNYHPDWKKARDTQQDAVGSRLTDEGWKYCHTHGVGPSIAAERHPEFVLPAEKPVLIDAPGTIDTTGTSAAEVPAEEGEFDALPIDTAPPKKPARKDAKSPVDGFDEWWKQYPKKVGKLDAKKAYRAAIKQGATPQDLLDGLQRHTANWKAKNTEPKYIPHPASWLRKGRWEDEFTTPAPNQTAPAINPVTGKALTREDFWYACVDHGIDPSLYVNFWKPSMGLPGDPGWANAQAYLDRYTGRG